MTETREGEGEQGGDGPTSPTLGGLERSTSNSQNLGVPVPASRVGACT